MTETSEDDVVGLLNSFDSLGLQEPSEAEFQAPETAVTGNDSTEATVKKTPRIADDVLGNTLGCLTCLQDMEDLVVAVKEASNLATKDGVTPLVSPLAINVASALFQPVDQRLCDVCGDLDVSSICSQLSQSTQAGPSSETKADTLSTSRLSLIGNFQKAWTLLHKLRKENSAAKKEAGPLSNVLEKQQDYFRRGAGGEEHAVEHMLTLFNYCSKLPFIDMTFTEVAPSFIKQLA